MENFHEDLIDLRWAGALPVGVIHIGDSLAMPPSLPPFGEEKAQPGGEEPVGMATPVVEADH
jgi:hypothetical protein